MTARGLPGSPGDEMFLDRPHGADSPTIEPLRVNRYASPPAHDYRTGSTDGHRIGGASNGGNNNNNPPRTFQPPLGGLSSPAPLPYPDFDPPTVAPFKAGAKLPYPDLDPRTTPPALPRFSPPPVSSPGSSGVPSYPRPQQSQGGGLAERRGNAPKPLPDSPGPDVPDKEGLFQRMPKRSQDDSPTIPAAASGAGGYDYNNQYFPPPSTSSSRPAQPAALSIPNQNQSSMNRLASTASVSTTRASRGSPPPPETPVVAPDDGVGGGIEARYAAAGIAGTGTLTELQARNAAAAQRQQQYQGHTSNAGPQIPPQRRWTPTEDLNNHPHGSPVTYQGQTPISPHIPQQFPGGTSPTSTAGGRAVSTLEQDLQGLQVSNDPPPAYSSVSNANTSTSYPNEKSRPVTTSSAGAPARTAAGMGAAAATAAAAAAAPQQAAKPDPNAGHPAYAIEAQHMPQTQQPQPAHAGPLTDPHAGAGSPTPSTATSQAAPPPLPEGWIAHIDPTSSQYYYIHLPTQSTQWEFPKGPTPLNLNDTPASPAASHFNNPLQSPSVVSFSQKPLQSPMFPPSTPGYAESVMTFQSATPTLTGFTGPPPSSGVEVYKVAPTNGVYFGPYLRYINMDLERGLWLGSILLVTDNQQPPTIHIHPSADLSPNPRQLKAQPISKHQRWTFYRYDIDVQMEDGGSFKWTYAITSHLGCTRYEFLVAGRHETNWRFVATSGNDFQLSVNANERAKLGGIGFMWKDIMAKHQECGGFHTQLGLGDQVYADRIWREVPLLKQWLAMSGKENRKNEAWSARLEEDVAHAYFHFWTSHFDQPYLREAWAQIPSVMSLGDHDIFDGFGSYPDYMQFSNIFKNIGRIAIDTYLLFAHHTTLEILRNVSDDSDIFTITGTGWHYLKFFGPAVTIVGPDCRSERSQSQILAGPTYQGIFPKVAMLPRSVQHCLWVLPSPVIYPRMEQAEQLMSTVATGKKAVTGAYNMLGKVAGGVAGVVGAKGVVGSGFDSVKKAVGKSGLMGGILNPFGDFGMMDELKDQWTHETKDLERTYLIRTLQGIAQSRTLRMSFLSGSVSCCGAGLLHDPGRPGDHKTMYQLISSAVVNAPPSSYILKMLHNNKQLYVPANGTRSNQQPSDTKEDMMEIFQNDPDGKARTEKKLMGRRNYVAIVAYDPEQIAGNVQGSGKLSLAADFMVQGEGGGSVGGVSRYGPVIIPNLEFGR